MSAPVSKSGLKQVATHDPVWQQLRDEAQAMVTAEPASVLLCLRNGSEP